MESTRTNSSGPRAARRLLTLLLAVTALAALMPAGQAQAVTRLDVPEESPGPPFYARLTASQAPHTDQWAAIVFYRNPACIPAGFNLLSFFDAPRAFGCGLTVEGFEIWRNGPGQDPAPILQKLRADGSVPVWFVSWPQLQAAMADGVLTIGELRALPSLITGLADRFRETLRPSASNRRGMINMYARGTLSDGRSFSFQFVEVEDKGVRHVSIRFR